MARCFAFFTLFHLSLTFFRPEVPFNIQINNYIYIELSIYKVYQEGSYFQVIIKRK